MRHPRALALLAEAGAQIEGTRVRFPAELVKRALDSAPARVTVSARGSSLPLELGRGHSYFGTGPDRLYCPMTRERADKTGTDGCAEDAIGVPAPTNIMTVDREA